MSATPFSGDATIWIDRDRINFGLSAEGMPDGVRLSASLDSWTGQALADHLHREQMRQIQDAPSVAGATGAAIRGTKADPMKWLDLSWQEESGRVEAQIFPSSSEERSRLMLRTNADETLLKVLKAARRVHQHVDRWKVLELVSENELAEALLRMTDDPQRVSISDDGRVLFFSQLTGRKQLKATVEIGASYAVIRPGGTTEDSELLPVLQAVAALPDERTLLVRGGGIQVQARQFVSMNQEVFVLTKVDVGHFLLESNRGLQLLLPFNSSSSILRISVGHLDEEDRDLVTRVLGLIDWRPEYSMVTFVHKSTPVVVEVEDEFDALMKKAQSLSLETMNADDRERAMKLMAHTITKLSELSKTVRTQL